MSLPRCWWMQAQALLTDGAQGDDEAVPLLVQHAALPAPVEAALDIGEGEPVDT